MSYILLDESGDLGFDLKKSGTSRYFIVTFLFTDKKRPIEKLVRNIHAGLRKKYKIRSGVLHAASQKKITNMRLCRALASMPVKLMTIYLDKTKVHTKMEYEKPVLYNYIVNILLDRVITGKFIKADTPVELIASRRETNKFLNQNFKDYLVNQAGVKNKFQLVVKIKTPYEEKSLQAVDIASWAIFRKYEREDEEFYRVLKPIIYQENAIFP